MLEASGRGLNPGVSIGNFFNFGNFEACLNAPEYSNPNGVSFSPQFALLQDYPQSCDTIGDEMTRNGAQVPLFTYIAVYRGACVPSSCSLSDLEKAWIDTSAVTSSLGRDTCTIAVDVVSKESKDFSAGEISFLIFVSFVTSVVCAGTIFDVMFLFFEGTFTNFKTNRMIQAVVAFSLYTNGRRLISTKQRKGKSSITCLHGIRFLTMFWVFVGHMYGLQADMLNNNYLTILAILQQKTTAFVMEASVSTDTFFFLSGLLVGYLLLLELRKNSGKFNLSMYYVHRYIRLTPVYAMMIWFVATVYTRIGVSPVWSTYTSPESGACQTGWWKNLLYIQKYFYPPADSDEEKCLPATWYLALDMQLYIIAPIFILPLYYFPIPGAALLAFLAPLNIISRLIALYKNDWSMWNFNKMYVAPYQRFGVYALGILTAYFIIEARKRQFRFKNYQLLLGWFSSLALLLLCIFFPSRWYAEDSMPVEIARIYNSIVRVVWSVGLMWIVLACDIGQGGPVNTFLSWKGFLPFSRLTYTAYLLIYKHSNHVYCISVTRMKRRIYKYGSQYFQ